MENCLRRASSWFKLIYTSSTSTILYKYNPIQQYLLQFHLIVFSFQGPYFLIISSGKERQEESDISRTQCLPTVKQYSPTSDWSYLSCLCATHYVFATRKNVITVYLIRNLFKATPCVPVTVFYLIDTFLILLKRKTNGNLVLNVL